MGTLWSEVIRKPLLFRHVVPDNARSLRINSYFPVYCIVFSAIFLLSHFPWWLLICNPFVPSPTSPPTCFNILCSLSVIKGSSVYNKVRRLYFCYETKHFCRVITGCVLNEYILINSLQAKNVFHIHTALSLQTREIYPYIL